MIGWWRAVMMRWPGGLLPIGAAAKVLGVSSERVRVLVAEGRLPCEVMPGGGRLDRFVPVDALLGAPTMLETGRNRVWNWGKMGHFRRHPWPKGWCADDLPPQYPVFLSESDDSGTDDAKS